MYDVPDAIGDCESDADGIIIVPPSPAPAIEPARPPSELPAPAPLTSSSNGTPLDANPGNDNCPVDNENNLDEDILAYLGEIPTKDKKFGPKIQTDIASRWEHIVTSGITKESRKEFQEKYLTPENCSLIDPPALNLEVKAALSEALLKKDTAIQNKQKQISAAISCIGQALKRAFSQDPKDSEMIKLLIDAGRIICDVQHTESMMRRGFIGSCIKKEVKDHLNDTRIDKYLFGDKLADTLKAAKSIHKSGSEIRASTSLPRPIPKNKPPTRHLNSKVPAQNSRPLPAGRRLEEAAPAPAVPRRRPPPPPPPPAPRSQQRPRALRR